MLNISGDQSQSFSETQFKNNTISNDNCEKLEMNNELVEGANLALDPHKTNRKNFEPSALSSLLNLKAVAASRASLTRRFSSNNSPSETPNTEEKYATLVEPDTCTSPSITSGLSMNVFQSKKSFSVNPFSRQQQVGHGICPEKNYSQNDAMKLTCNSKNTNQQHFSLKDISKEPKAYPLSNCNKINVDSPNSHLRSNPTLFSGISGFARLHDFADPLPSPASAVASLTRDLESDLNRLELRDWASQGQYVVKPQVISNWRS